MRNNTSNYGEVALESNLGLTLIHLISRRNISVLGTLAIFVYLSLVPTFAATPPTLDGLIDSVYFSDGYSIDYEGFYPEARATFRFIDDTGVDATYIWATWEITTDFNDNSYGDNRHSSWPAGHSFGDLAESDLQRIDLVNSCGEVVLDATMDYLDGPLGVEPGPGQTYATNSGYDVGMDASESVKIYINGGDWSKFAYDTSLAAMLNDDTSNNCLSLNCSIGGTNLLVNSPLWDNETAYDPASPYDDWEYSLIWEMRIDRSIFVTTSCPQGGIEGVATDPIELHASPSKIGVSPVTLFRVNSSIGDYVWLDEDRDGIQDTDEHGISNVTVILYTDPNGDGNTSDGVIIATTVTDANGFYSFNQLGSGNYIVDVTDDNGALTGYSLTTGSTDPHGPIVLGAGEA